MLQENIYPNMFTACKSFKQNIKVLLVKSCERCVLQPIVLSVATKRHACPQKCQYRLITKGWSSNCPPVRKRAIDVRIPSFPFIEDCMMHCHVQNFWFNHLGHYLFILLFHLFPIRYLYNFILLKKRIIIVMGHFHVLNHRKSEISYMRNIYKY